MPGQLEKAKVNVTLLGTFDPAAALPDKLGAAGVIRDDEAEAARFKGLVPGQLTDYRLEWGTVTVILQRFTVESAEPPFVRISDFLRKTVSELMPEAVITSMGINRNYTIKFSSVEERDALGTRLVPPAAWGNWGRRIQQSISANPDGKHGGMMTVTMREFPIANREGGMRHVILAPDPTSTLAANLTLNDHFVPNDEGFPVGLEPEELSRRRTTSILNMLAEHFDSSLNQLETIAREILSG